jgi:phosphoribosylglycinamide formyltransferase-1
MVSGGGTNLQAVLDACADGCIPARVVCVISSKAGVFALERAEKADVPVLVINPRDYADQQAHDAAVISALKSFDAQAVVLAGYMSILGPTLVRRYQYRIINIHPALIPSFCGKGYYGRRVHAAVLEYGAKVSGATTHFVDEGTDTGPIIMQKTVDVLDDDTPETLAARILEVEHRILVQSVALLCEGRLRVEGRRVKIDKIPQSADADSPL